MMSPPVTEPVQFGPQKKKVFLFLPYCGVSSVKLQRQLKRMYSVVFPWISLIIVFKPVCKLSLLSKLKSPIPTMTKSHLVYKVNCCDCNEFYVGMTCRRLEQRLSEHSSGNCNSALFQHSAATGHSINFQVPEILAMDNTKIRILVKETLKIQETRAFNHLNRNTGSFELQLW